MGIGTTSPARSIDVESSAGTSVGIRLNSTGTGGRSYSFFSTNNGSGLGGGKFGIYDDTAQLGRIVLDSNGNVGFATNSDAVSSRIQIKGAGTTSATSTFNATNSSGTSLLFVRDDGNVGIGTSSPLYPVVIANRGPAGLPQRSLAIGNTATNGTFMYLGSSASTSGYNLIQSITTEGTAYGNLVLQPEAGDVGIATTSPQAKLHVAGTVRIDSTSSQPNTVAHNVELLYTNTATDNIAMGEPDVWLQININGTVYAIPAYAPA